ncbi:hypothetical protein [Yoonia sp.]|jgi:hypothetical protein|uniref:hypothetical protein n=1 Tax=Yoonia sp. TaxID=2212373 RepID=UPI0025EB1CB0|nr:hypothetical protein [Yoonia sp.]
MRIALFLICCGACAPFPALEGSVSATARNAPYPQLTALSPLLQQTTDTATNDTVLARRIAALQARAARLRQTDIAALQ